MYFVVGFHDGPAHEVEFNGASRCTEFNKTQVLIADEKNIAVRVLHHDIGLVTTLLNSSAKCQVIASLQSYNSSHFIVLCYANDQADSLLLVDAHNGDFTVIQMMDEGIQVRVSSATSSQYSCSCFFGQWSISIHTTYMQITSTKHGLKLLSVYHRNHCLSKVSVDEQKNYFT